MRHLEPRSPASRSHSTITITTTPKSSANQPPSVSSSPNASWHVDYRDTAFVYFGGLPYELSEGDVITIFSQFGEPTFLKLARDKETGKSRGFGWLKYEDQRSTDLAVDNLGGATINGRLISVDHARYKPRDDEEMEEGRVDWESIQLRERMEKGVGDGTETNSEESEDEEVERRKHRPMLKEEKELMLLEQDHDDDDPMKAFLIEEKKKEVEEALRRESKRADREKKHRSRHHRSHRSRRGESDEDEDRPRRRRRRRDEEDEVRKDRSRRDDTPVTRQRRDSRERDMDRRRHDREGSRDHSGHRHRHSDRDRRRQDRERS